MMWTEWTTAQIALVISGMSFILALTSLIWNVWSKFIFPKAKVRVTLSVVYYDPTTQYILAVNDKGEVPEPWNNPNLVNPSVRISATNFGPGAITLESAIAKKSKFSSVFSNDIALLNPYIDYPSNLSSSGPFSGGLPAKLGVGDEISAYFPISPSWIGTEKLSKFGFHDRYGRSHYCKTRDVQSLRRAIFRHEKELTL